MERLIRSIGLTMVVLGLAGMAVAQDPAFDLTLDVPENLEGVAGDPIQYEATGVLTTTGLSAGDDGAQGWSLSIAVNGGVLLDITTAGTAAEVADTTGFAFSEVIDPADNGGQDGAVSAVVLGLQEVVMLPPEGASDIVKLTIEDTVPALGTDPDTGDPICEPITNTIEYVDGLIGSGQAVDNKITYQGNTVLPSLSSADTTICPILPVPSCCDDEMNLGFSAVVKRSDVAFEDIINVEEPDADPELCGSTGGLIEVAPGDVSVYANIVSQVTEGLGAQGWSLSIKYTGDLALVDATTSGVALEDFQPLGFDVTEVVDPAKNDGQEGVVSAVVLGLVVAKNLPAVGTESVLDIALQGELGQTGRLWFESGLIGQGQPVPNNITLRGGSVVPCNTDTASVDLTVVEPPFGAFIRGNANDDGKVDIADPIWIINELFREGEPTTCQDAADANDDALVDLSDAVYLIDFQFLGGPPPTAPFPDCGPDPELDDDGLTCEVTQKICLP